MLRAPVTRLGRTLRARMFSYEMLRPIRHSTDQMSVVMLIMYTSLTNKTHPDFSIEMYEKLQNLYVLC